MFRPSALIDIVFAISNGFFAVVSPGAVNILLAS